MNYEDVTEVHEAKIENGELDIFCFRYQRLVDKLEFYRDSKYNINDVIIPDECWLVATVVVDGVEIGIVEITVEGLPSRFRQTVLYTGFLFEGVVYGLDYFTARYNDVRLNEDGYGCDDEDEDEEDYQQPIPLHLSDKELMVEFFEFLDDYYDNRNRN